MLSWCKINNFSNNYTLYRFIMKHSNPIWWRWPNWIFWLWYFEKNHSGQKGWCPYSMGMRFQIHQYECPKFLSRNRFVLWWVSSRYKVFQNWFNICQKVKLMGCKKKFDDDDIYIYIYPNKLMLYFTNTNL